MIPLQLSAIERSAEDVFAPHGDWAAKGALSRKMDEARAVLEDLRRFADAAQQAIEMGQRIKTLRLENERLRQGIADFETDGHQLQRHLFDETAETSRLMKAITANWILTLKLKHQDQTADHRLILARDALTTSKKRLASLYKRVDERHNAIQDLRAKSAALAAEIGRMRRQIIISHQETRLIEQKSQAIDISIRELRHLVSARLRALLAKN